MEDDFGLEYHLTPTGWVKGTERHRKNMGARVTRPESAVETWKWDVYQRSMWSEEQNSVEMLWHDESVSQHERDALRAKFNRPFPEASVTHPSPAQRLRGFRKTRRY